jgi:hypothetical protein
VEELFGSGVSSAAGRPQGSQKPTITFVHRHRFSLVPRDQNTKA